jgi:iron complex outermembrane receptor protein
MAIEWGEGAEDSPLYWRDDLIGPGMLNAGVSATFIDKYDQSALEFGGVPIFGDYSAVGFTNYERFPGTVSEWRALGFVNYNVSNWNIRYELRYVQGVTDDRANPFVYDADGQLVEITWGEKVKDYYSNNLYVNWNGPWQTRVGLSVINAFDEDPSKARHQLGYDPYIGDPLGRTIELSLKKTFGAAE